MSNAKSQVCVGCRDLVNCVSKGDLVTWRLGPGDSSAELGDISVAAATGKKAGIIAPHPSRLQVFVAALPDNEKDPGDIFVMGLSNGRCLRTLSGHSRKVTSMLWLPSVGLVSGSEDGTCRLWPPRGEGREIYATGRTRTYLRETDPEKVTAFVADGEKRLFVANQGGGIDIVDLKSPYTCKSLLPLWKERRLKDVPKTALDAYALKEKKIYERIERKKKAGTLGDTTSEEERKKREQEAKQEEEEFEITNKRPLAKRAGDQDNSIMGLAYLASNDLVAATTVSGEVLVVGEGRSHESLVIFRKSYSGSIEVGCSVEGSPRIYVGNRGFDAKAIEVVVLGVEPFEQLRRVKLKDDIASIVGLHWCPTEKKLLVAYDEAGLYAFDAECRGHPQTLFDSAEEHPDSMSNETAYGFVERAGCLLVRTSWSRVRRFNISSFKEMEPFVPSSQNGVVGRAQTAVNRTTGTLFSLRSGYDNHKLDMAKPGDQTWTKQANLRPFAGWPPSFIKALEWQAAPNPEDRHMIVLGGELGGLYELKEGAAGEAPTTVGFKGMPAGDISNHAVAACSAWDTAGALIFLRSSSGRSFVFDWAKKELHGQMKCCKEPSLLTRLAAKDKALAAAWDEGAVAVFDLRALAKLQKFSLAAFPRPWCLFGAEDGRLFAYCATDNKGQGGRLAAWKLPAERQDGQPLLGSDSVTEAQPQVEMAPGQGIEPATSMMLLPSVGLLVAHRQVKDGISVFCHITGTWLYRLRPASSGTSLQIWPGPGKNCVLWAASGGGRTGYLRWNFLCMIGKTHVENGEPRFPIMTILFFFLDVWSILVSIGQILSFALAPMWEHHESSGGSFPELDLRLPALWESPPVQKLSEVLEVLQGLDIPHIPWVCQFYGTIVFIAMFAMLILGQEVIEARAYLYPESCWVRAFELASKLAKVIVQSVALPLLTYIISGLLCRHTEDNELFEVGCFTRKHIGLVIFPGVVAGLVLQILCFRFARVGFDLANMDAGLNLLDMSTDYVPLDPEPENLASSMSSAYQNTSILGKVVLRVVKTLTPLVRQAGLRLELMTGLNAVVGLAISVASLTTDVFIMRPINCWIQPCCLQFAQDAANSWMFLCIFLAAAVTQGIVPDGQWLDSFSYVVLVIFPVGFLVRLFKYRLQRGTRGRPEQRNGYTPLGQNSVT